MIHAKPNTKAGTASRKSARGSASAKPAASTVKQLERLFAAEIDGRDIRLAKTTADKLERLGFIHRVQHSNRDRLGTFTWETHELTHAGRYAYCVTCTDEPEPEAVA